MTVLKVRLETYLPYNLYWFCHRASSILQLPDFLNHPDVYFVVSREEARAGRDITIGAMTEATTAALESVPTEAFLPATAVFDAFIRNLGIETPRLTNDPLSFFIEQLRVTLPPDEKVHGQDIYAFRSVIVRLERAKQREDEERVLLDQSVKQLEHLREAVRGAEYDEAFVTAHAIDIGGLSDEQLKELMDTLDSVNLAMPNTMTNKPFVCDIIFECFEALEHRGKDAGSFRAHPSISWKRYITLF